MTILNNTTIYSIFIDILFYISVIYIALVSIISTIIERSTNTFYGFYFLIIYSICAFWSWKNLLALKLSDIKLFTVKRTDTIVFLIFSLLFLFLYYNARAQHFLSFEVWTDELVQAFSLEIYGVKDISTVAALQQQPPTDYYLSRFATQAFGLSELSIRFNSIIFGFLSAVIFALSLFRFNMPLLYLFGFLISFLYQGILVNYSYEARPISLAVFYFIYLSILYIRYIEGELIDPKNYFIASWCTLTSIGLQPLLACFALLPSLYLMSHKPHAEKRKIIFGIPLFTLAITTPLFFNIYNQSNKINQFYDVNYFSAVVGGIANFKLNDFIKFYQLIIGTELIWISPLLIFLAIGLKKLFDKKDRSQYLNHILAWILFHLIFIFIYQATWGIINWPVRSRYFVLLYVGSILLSAYIFSIWTNHIFSKFKTLIAPAVGAIIATFFLWQLIYHYMPNHYRYAVKENKFRLTMKPLFEYAASDSNIKILLPVPLVQIGYERGVKTTSLPSPLYMKSTNYFVNEIFHICPNAKRLLCFRPFNKLFPNPQPNQIIMFIRTDLSTQLPPNYYENMLNIKGFPAINLNSKFIVSTLVIKKSINETIEEALLSLAANVPNDEQSFFILESLIDYYIFNAKYDRASVLLKKLKHLSFRPRLSTDYNDYTYNTEVESLIKYYAERLKSPL